MKRVVFASGKGGTGKTTVTALMAHLAAPERLLVLADCDVEASNLSIALKARTSAREPFAGMPVARIDRETCRGCGACVPVCRFDAIRPDPSVHSRTYVVDEWACEGCGACVRACSDGALTMVPSEAGHVVDGATVVGPIAFGELVPGQDLSGKLVTEVRGHAEVAGKDWGAELVLIDGPPGVGCPATASIADTDLVVAVAEPTVSGVHDLRRLIGLARRLGVPVVVIVNKADLSDEGAQHLRELLEAEQVALIGEIPYDPELAGVLGRLADCRSRAKPDGPGYRAAADMWPTLVSMLA